jgi:hypothetical protein
MITERERVLERPSPPRVSDRVRRVPEPSQQRPATTPEPSLAWRLLMVVIGFGIAALGWSLVMSVFLAFIGLPVFIFGLALMQAQET